MTQIIQDHLMLLLIFVTFLIPEMTGGVITGRAFDFLDASSPGN